MAIGEGAEGVREASAHILFDILSEGSDEPVSSWSDETDRLVSHKTLTVCHGDVGSLGA